MANKRNKIFLLKQKLAEMQNELNIMEKTQHIRQERSKSFKKQRPIQASPQRNTYKNRQFKSPTFWGSNPITHDDTYSPKRHQQSISPTNRSQQKQHIQRNYSPILKNVVNTVDRQYYNSVKQYKEKEVHDINYFYQTAYVGKRFQNSAFGMTRGSLEKEQKKKTFQIKKTDTILNPQKQKVSCRKVVKIIQKSPEKMFTQNPNSNPNMYFYANRTIMMDRKGSMQDKNKSNIILGHCASELFTSRPKDDDLGKKRKKSQKKHFLQYFRDTLESQF